MPVLKPAMFLLVAVAVGAPSAHAEDIFQFAPKVHDVGTDLMMGGAITIGHPFIPIAQIVGGVVLVAGIGTEAVGVPAAAIADLVAAPFREDDSPRSHRERRQRPGAR